MSDIQPWVDNLTNLSNDTFMKSFETLWAGMGKDVFFTFVFSAIAIGLYIQSEHSIPIMVAYFFGIAVFCAVLVSPLAMMIFGLCGAFLGGGALYKSLVSKR